MTPTGDDLYFIASVNNTGSELWKSDGTQNGTFMVKDINAGQLSSYAGYFSLLNNTVLFSAYTPSSGTELWKTDGTTTGTLLLKDINETSTASSSPFALTPMNGKVIFGATDSSAEYARLWKTDGTTANTDSIKNYQVYNQGVQKKFTKRDSLLYFFGRNFNSGKTGLCTSDGTNAGTGLIKEINVNSFSWLIAANKLLYFVTFNNNYNYSLWRSDGTPSGTFEVESGVNEIFEFFYQSADGPFATLGDTLIFFQKNTTGFYELWTSDGTTAGTKKLKDINPGHDTNPRSFCVYKGFVYFSAGGPPGVNYLWKTDGTEQGTVIAFPNLTNPENLTISNEILYFQATGQDSDAELWKTDGTLQGTQLVKNINPQTSSYPGNLFDGNGILYFLANDGVHGFELWKSNGTEQGTQLIKDITPGNENTWLSASPDQYAIVNAMGKIYFAVNGILWTSDGTEVGTTPVEDINLKNGSQVGGFAVIRDQLYFSAFDYEHSTELYAGKVQPLLIPSYMFNGDGNFDSEENWLNHLIAPVDILEGVEVIIAPQANGKCILNVPLNIKGGKLTIKPGAKIDVKGNVIIH